MLHPGHYHDGLTSQRLEVEISVTREALRFFRNDGTLVDEWPYAGLRLAEEVSFGSAPRFRHRDKGEAVLTAAGPQVLNQIERQGGPRLRQHPLLKPTWKAALVSTVLVAVILAALWMALPLLVAPVVRLIPPQWETGLGDQVISHMAQGRAFCEGASGDAALQRLASRLLAGVEAPYPITVRVLPHEAVNAFAATGGQVVIFQGLIDAAENPEEVAGVLAHEMAHAAERHPMQGLVRAMGISLLFNLMLGNASSLDALAAQMAQVLLVLSYNREAELEADRVGMEILNQADIRGGGLTAFFRRMTEKSQAGRQVPQLFSTHPMHGERIQRLQGLATGAGDALTPEQWAALQGICGEAA